MAGDDIVYGGKNCCFCFFVSFDLEFHGCDNDHDDDKFCLVLFDLVDIIDCTIIFLASIRRMKMSNMFLKQKCKLCFS